MRRTLLFILSALSVGLVLIAWEAGKMGQYRADHQAYTKPGTVVEGEQ